MENQIQNLNKIKNGIEKSELIDEAISMLDNYSDISFREHSIRTALLLQEIGARETAVIAGILHHIPEENINFKNFPQETADEISLILKKSNQLRGLFNLNQKLKTVAIKKWRKEFLNRQSENLRRMFFAISQSIEPILITLAGRLDEMVYLAKNYQKEEQIKKANMALEILAPLAYGIGIAEIKSRLEDSAFPYLYPKEYNWLLKTVREKYEEREIYLEKIKSEINGILNKEKISVISIGARAKHYFSLYQKLLRYDMDIEKIYDLVALRIVVPDIETCYKVLGTIHSNWQPLQGRIKDYIASPKANGYRSLHTTVFCDNNKIVEFQIRTLEMHQEADFGAVAHLNYKEKTSQKSYQKSFYWLDQLRKWQEEIKDPQVMASQLKNDLFKNQIFVVTPKGDIINLPKGSTSVDFAYEVHTVIGEHCEGAKINGKLTPIDKPLQTGERIEIITNKNRAPSAKWLRFVKTHKAKAKISGFLEKAYGVPQKQKTKISTIRERMEDLRQILPARKKEPVCLIGGTGSIAFKLSKCCSPNQGDSIFAFISTGEPASVHKNNCLNLKELKEKWPEKIIQANWKTS